jgi:hypothetical protein
LRKLAQRAFVDDFFETFSDAGHVKGAEAKCLDEPDSFGLCNSNLKSISIPRRGSTLDLR